MRAGDPVRSLIAYNKLNVKLAGGYAGLSDFADGASHQSVTDLAVMTAMANLTVISPPDITTTRQAVTAMLDYDGPVYLRLAREAVEFRDGEDGLEVRVHLQPGASKSEFTGLHGGRLKARVGAKAVEGAANAAAVKLLALTAGVAKSHVCDDPAGVAGRLLAAAGVDPEKD